MFGDGGGGDGGGDGDGDGDVFVISVLQFSSLQRKDNGMYVCQAMNTFNQTVTFTVATNAITIIVLDNY